jgi:fructan beta-fructosidase
VKPGDNPLSGISSDLFDIELEVEPVDATEFGIRLYEAALSWANGKVSCLGATADLSPVDGRLKLRILVDRTSIEIFGNDGEVSMTSCFLPNEQNTGLDLYARDGTVKIRSLTVSRLSSCWNNSE